MAKCTLHPPPPSACLGLPLSFTGGEAVWRGGGGEGEVRSLGHLGWGEGRAHPQFCLVGGAGCISGRDPPCCVPHPTPKPQESSWLSRGILDVVVGGGWPC